MYFLSRWVGLFLACSLLLVASSYAQSGALPSKDLLLPTLGVKVWKDGRIDSFYKDLQAIQIKESFPEEVPVYQIQVLSSKNRLDALKVKKDLEELILDLPTDIHYKEPYYKLRVGVYRNAQDAEPMRQHIDDFLGGKRAVIVVPTLMKTAHFIDTFIKARNINY